MATDVTRRVLVVIPTLNEARTLAGVLHSLTRDLPPALHATFVVADGGSNDGTVELARKLGVSIPGLHLIHNPRRIQSAAVNLAAAQFRGDADVLIRCDAHAQYPVRFLQQLLETLDRTQADSVVVPMDSTGSTCFQKAVAWTSNTWAGTGGSAHRGGRRSGYVDHGHHAAFRMAAFLGAGGYNESFTHNEDAELDCRLGQLGRKIYLDAELRLGYHPRATPAALWKQYFSYGRGRSRTVRRHPGSMRLRQMAVPVHLLLTVFAIAASPWSLWPLLWPLLYAGALSFTSLQLALRHTSACGLLAGPAAAIMHTAWAMGFFAGLLFIRETPWSPPSAPQPENGAGMAR